MDKDWERERERERHVIIVKFNDTLKRRESYIQVLIQDIFYKT